MDEIPLLKLLGLLLARLERISVDSYWAHRASGVRGSLMRALEKFESGQSVNTSQLTKLMDFGFQILKKSLTEKFRP